MNNPILPVTWVSALLDPGPQHSRPMTPFVPQGLVLHSTADPGATAQQIRNYFNSHRGASAHFAVDWAESLVLIPWEPHNSEIAWHAGPSANIRFLGMECCEPADGPDATAQFQAVYATWIRAAADVLTMYEWPADENHVWSHARVSQTWPVETNHHDPLPFLTKYGVSWDEVMRDIVASMSKSPIE